MYHFPCSITVTPLTHTAAVQVCHAVCTHNGLIVVPGPGADTDHHLDFPLPIKVVLEEVCQLRVTVLFAPLSWLSLRGEQRQSQ